jgi:hypothetical protein
LSQSSSTQAYACLTYQALLKFAVKFIETSNSETLAAFKLKIANNKLAKFKGIARVSITYLNFLHLTRQVDNKIVKQLIKDFKGEGCIREEPIYRIPAIINNLILEEALRKILLTAKAFKAKVNNPLMLKLRSKIKLECFYK